MFYTIPDSLKSEIDELEAKVRLVQEGRLEPSAFKAHRVPFGVYEQRKDNTFMTRIRCTGGALTPAQLREIAQLSKKYGADTIHITTRQELQIHDVSLSNVIPIMRELLPLGLSTRGGGGNTVRNIVASFDSGIAPDEVFDVLPYVSALTNRLIREPDSWVLPRKYKLGFSNSPRDNARAAFQDLGFIAKVQNGVQGFEVYVAGGMGTKPQVGQVLHEFLPGSDVYLAAEAIKRLFDKNGNRKNRYAARLRFLWNTLGRGKFVELYQQELEKLRQENPAPLVLPRFSTEPTAPKFAPIVDTSSDFQLWRKRYVTAQKQPGLYSILVPIFLGNLKNDHALALADFLEAFGDDVLRATAEQNLALRNIPEDYLGNVFEIVKTVSTLSSQPRFLASAVACTGASTCKLGICLPRGALSAIVKELQRSNLDLDQVSDLRMNLSGCPNTCGGHMSADLGFFGKVGRKEQIPYPSYGVVLGAEVGNSNPHLAEPVGDVAARDLPAFVADFVGHYIVRKSQFASFADYVRNEGRQHAAHWCEEHRDVPAFDEDKNYYYDWTANEVFSLASRGVGECSAGLFDLIEFDLKKIKEIQEELPELAKDQRADALYRLTLSAARMLLITRGVEARSDSEVFRQFRHHFIESGLVSNTFLTLVGLAEKQDRNGVSGREQEVAELANTMERLYRKMDNSLRFPGELPKAPAKVAERPQSDASRDFRGVACPMNFVKTKLALAPLASGQRLRILLDDGAPIQNVPRSVAEEGHKIIEQVKDGNWWSVLIEKR